LSRFTTLPVAYEPVWRIADTVRRAPEAGRRITNPSPSC